MPTKKKNKNGKIKEYELRICKECKNKVQFDDFDEKRQIFIWLCEDCGKLINSRDTKIITLIPKK